MLCLRVARGSRPGAILRRLLLAAVSAGTGFLLLCALGYALVHPGRAEQAGIRLLWCLVPAAAAVQLAAAVSRMRNRGRGPGLAAGGYGASRLALLAAAVTGISYAFGSVLALVAFLFLGGMLLGTEPALPFAGTLTLLSLVPLLGAAAAAMTLRPRQARPSRERTSEGPEERDGREADDLKRSGGSGTSPAGLPWGAMLVATGLALEMFSDRWQPWRPGEKVPLPGGLGGLPSTMLAGWSLTAVGFVLAAPGLVHLCGRVLASARPGALRLIAGRALQAEATRIGRPLGVLCSVGSAALASVRLWSTAADPRPGPLTVLGATLVLVCVVAALVAATLESRGARMPVTATLTRIGMSSAMLRWAAAVRLTALAALLVPVTWAVAELTALPMRF